MELYILDDTFKRETVLEGYESVIWTERYYGLGEVQIVIDPSLMPKALSVPGVMLGLNRSNRVMRVDTYERKEEADGSEMMTIKGSSLEAYLLERPNQSSVVPETTPGEPPVIQGLPSDIMLTLFDEVCRNNTVVPQDNLSWIQPGIITPPGLIPFPDEVVEMRMDIGTLYDSIFKVADVYKIGFRIVKDGDSGNLYFEVYMGDERHSRQTDFPAVIFGKSLDNLSEVAELSSSALYRNVAYVYGRNGTKVVYAASGDADLVDMARRVLVVQAYDIELPPGPELDIALTQRGREALAQNAMVAAFDGKIDIHSTYQYGIDYNLGDIVEQRSLSGSAREVRVQEQVFVSDREGERSYPTFVLDEIIIPNTWYSWTSNQVWDDAPGYWYDY
jgi:hypothetical protein